MTLMTKRVNGVPYYYYQQVVKNSGKTEVLTTEIGRKGIDLNEFNQRRWLALEEHGKKIKNIWLESQKKYHFENNPEYHDIDELLDIKFGYQTFKNELPPNELKEFEQVLFIRYVYGTTALEGNTYTESETSELINSGLKSATKSPTEATEISNYNQVRTFVNNHGGAISEQFIRNLHSILMKGIKKPDGRYVNAGKYRTEESKLNNIFFVPSSPDMIETKMKFTIEEFYTNLRKSIHPVELACIFHQRFEEIHPFEDGNGRTGREVLNHMLRRLGFPQIYIPPLEHRFYFYSLVEGNKPNYVPLIDFVIHRMYQSLFYFITRTSLSENTYSEEYKKFYEETEGKEEYKRFIQLNDKYPSYILP
jgi:Fic family protein